MLQLPKIPHPKHRRLVISLLLHSFVKYPLYHVDIFRYLFFFGGYLLYRELLASTQSVPFDRVVLFLQTGTVFGRPADFYQTETTSRQLRKPTCAAVNFSYPNQDFANFLRLICYFVLAVVYLEWEFIWSCT